MGRTVMPYSRAVEATDLRLQDFRKSLRKDDREIFDELMRYAKTQIQAGVMAANPNPFDSMSLTMHIQLAKKLKNALAEIEKLKQELAKTKPES
ncbi:MAG TPA: hypothetical protein PK079_19430 [Leptospiraceae bacterium]|nr:hypothetical protein [Leptospiraceae bacterium]HMW04686.1 hypothetical protein [Leptospiraceae bacterium]HMX35379.1 hypothetical protein [Leptospiraceae bacterium]HMY30522.1 hypothetical protein [Leptospiraceae bacterium]HMZ66274.1 hypothetical protein [Leptospiraceae bacterium]